MTISSLEEAIYGRALQEGTETIVILSDRVAVFVPQVFKTRVSAGEMKKAGNRTETESILKLPLQEGNLGCQKILS